MPCIIVILASNLQLTPLWSASRTWGNTWERSGPRRDSRWGRRGGRGRSTCSCWRRHSCWPRGSDDPSWARSSRTRSNGARGQASRTHTSHNSAQRPANGNIYSHAITSFFRPLWRRFTVYFHYSWPGWSSWPQAGPCRWRSARGTSAAPHHCRRSPRGRAPPGWGRTSWGCRPASSTLFSSTSSNFSQSSSSVDNNLAADTYHKHCEEDVIEYQEDDPLHFWLDCEDAEVDNIGVVWPGHDPGDHQHGDPFEQRDAAAADASVWWHLNTAHSHGGRGRTTN